MTSDTAGEDMSTLEPPRRLASPPLEPTSAPAPASAPAVRAATPRVMTSDTAGEDLSTLEPPRRLASPPLEATLPGGR